ncbi:hypothetical protein [Sinomonas atrocyanea]|uniref:hypothetical protein n=1 Tax=Sinomonas atrocyanea TaxID=37927 RepID=UPI00278020FF|nr:hypothetical protein [Sinomonas atrocyanea]MDQ0259482.1 hypothetical protein [Sinomonas atrocyanea]
MGWGNFFRAPLASWNGPVDGWVHFTPSTGRPWQPEVYVRTSGVYRSWPLRFRDAEGLKAVWARLEEFAGAGGTVRALLGNIAWADSHQALLEQPDRALQAVTLEAEKRPIASDDGAVAHPQSVSVALLAEPERVSSGPLSEEAFVVIRSFLPAEPGPDDHASADELRKLLDEHCRPMTAWERRRNRPVIERRSEAKLYADRRTRRVGWASWVASVGTVVAGDAALNWLGMK